MAPSDPNWGSAYPSVAHALWRTTGELVTVEAHLPNLVRYIDSLQAGVRATGLGAMHAKYGDWLAPAEAATPSKPLCSAAAFIHDVGLVAEMAEAAGNATTATRLRALRASGVEQDCNPR